MHSRNHHAIPSFVGMSSLKFCLNHEVSEPSAFRPVDGTLAALTSRK